MKDDEIDDDERDSSCPEENAGADSDATDDADDDNCKDNGKLSCFIHTSNNMAISALRSIQNIAPRSLTSLMLRQIQCCSYQSKRTASFTFV